MEIGEKHTWGSWSMISLFRMPGKKSATTFVSPIVVAPPAEVLPPVPASPEKAKRSADDLTPGQVRSFVSPVSSPNKKPCLTAESVVEVLATNLSKQVFKLFQSEETQELYHSLVLYQGVLAMLITPIDIQSPGKYSISNLKYSATLHFPVLTQSSKARPVEFKKMDEEVSGTIGVLPNEISSFDDFLAANNRQSLRFLCGRLSHTIKGEGKSPWKLSLVVGEGKIINITFFCASEELGVTQNTFVCITNTTKDIFNAAAPSVKMGQDSTIIQMSDVFPSSFVHSIQTAPEQFLSSIPVESVSELQHHQASPVSRDDVVVLF